LKKFKKAMDKENGWSQSFKKGIGRKPSPFFCLIKHK
jgi:hypothetical protein